MKKIVINFLIIFSICAVFFTDQLVEVTNNSFYSYLDEILVLILGLFAFIKILKEKKIDGVAFKFILIAALFYLTGVVSAVINSNYSISIVLLSGLLSTTFFLAIIFFMILDFDEYIILRTFRYFEYIAIISAVFAMLNMFFPDFYLFVVPWAFIRERFGIITPFSIFEHPGTYGWYMMFISGYYYSNYISTNKKKSLFKFLLYTLFALTSLRAKVIGSFVVTILAGRLFGPKGIKLKFKYIFSSFIVSLIVILIFREFLIYTFYHYFTMSGTEITPRAAFNIYSFDILVNFFPLGVGFSQFGTHYARVYYSEYYYHYNMHILHGMHPEAPTFGTDTFWPAIFGETGFIGSFLFIYGMITIYKSIKKSINYFDDITIPLWAMIIFFQGLAESIGIQTFNSAPQNIVIAFVVGSTIKMGINKKRIDTKSQNEWS